MSMQWPDLEELKQVLNVDTDAWDGEDDLSRLTAVLDSAITKVKGDVGLWDEYEDVPDTPLNRAALRMAELMALRPDAAEDNARDPVYQSHLFGHRKRFGVG